MTNKNRVFKEIGEFMTLPYIAGLVMIVIALCVIVFSRTVTDVSSVGFRYTANFAVPGIFLVMLALSVERLCNDSPKTFCAYMFAIGLLGSAVVHPLPMNDAWIAGNIGLALFVVTKVRRLCMGMGWFESDRQFTGSAPTATAAPSAPTGVRSSYPARQARYDFSSVIGMDELKSRLNEAGQEIAVVHAKGGTARNGILLSGEPGNGKSFIAEALAGQLRLPFLPVDISSIESKWIGQKVEQLKAVFDEARRQAPCLLFFDEADSMLMDRSSIQRGDSDDTKAVNTMLTELVELRHSGVVIVAATNYLDKLDAAAIREGRFDFKIEVPAPDAAARRGIILRAMTEFKGTSLHASALEQATKRWDGFSVARIKTVVDEAGRAAIKTGARLISYADMQSALRTVQGRKGKLPENTPSISELSMEAAQKAQLRNIGKRMRNIATVEDMGGSVPTGMLFYGPPGTGKTLTARALAKDSGWAFLMTCGADLLAKPEMIDKLVRDAKDMRPCIVFIDEADDVCGDRDRSAQYVGSITNKLLSAIDGADGRSQDVLWIAATNHFDRFDAAMLRRFTEKVAFQVPDGSALQGFISKWVAASKARFDRTASADVIAEIVAGLPIANVEQVLQQAVNVAVSRSMEKQLTQATVTAGDIARALSIVMG